MGPETVGMVGGRAGMGRALLWTLLCGSGVKRERESNNVSNVKNCERAISSFYFHE